MRSYKPEVHQQLLAAIARIAKGEAIAAGATREPLVWIDPQGAARATFNDEALTKRLSVALAQALNPITEPNWGLLNAAGLVAALVPAILAFIFRGAVMRGMLSGAIKG